MFEQYSKASKVSLFQPFGETSSIGYQTSPNQLPSGWMITF
jgi:hypothetical protein